MQRLRQLLLLHAARRLPASSPGRQNLSGLLCSDQREERCDLIAQVVSLTDIKLHWVPRTRHVIKLETVVRFRGYDPSSLQTYLTPGKGARRKISIMLNAPAQMMPSSRDLSLCPARAAPLPCLPFQEF